MADAKISALTDGVTPADTDESPWARVGTNVKLTWLELRTALQTVLGSLTLTSGTQVASAPALVITQTWNNAAVAFSALQVLITNTASLVTSKLIELKVGGVNIFAVNRNLTDGFTYGTVIFRDESSGQLSINRQLYVASTYTQTTQPLSIGGSFGGTDTCLRRKAASVLELSNVNTSGAGAGTAFRLVPQTVAQLTAAATAGDGAIAVVSDSTLPYVSANIGTAVVGGGANQAKVTVIAGAWVIG